MSNRVRLTYFDQNDGIAPQFPVNASVVSGPLTLGDSADWFKIRLDESITWQGISHTYALIRSRWIGLPILGAQQTSVFLLLASGDEFDLGVVQGLPIVAWCQCDTIAT
jgi:hypothetical protein